MTPPWDGRSQRSPGPVHTKAHHMRIHLDVWPFFFFIFKTSSPTFSETLSRAVSARHAVIQVPPKLKTVDKGTILGEKRLLVTTIGFHK
ncbi:hypothetical protein PNOK_0161700 [Pyrrhoderma noxium]|uniref:Uncharacterized protein n=1 Tax=Pyrrhoderma noxium TaxID=2282107 RepID=A0A286UQ11_9AGAM|nr:hypothetical protein PNOK_0161700 [Pyrrhoderma noxium]